MQLYLIVYPVHCVKQNYMMRYWFEMCPFLHLVFCTINIYELMFESQLSRKTLFALLILLLPVAGIILFEKERGRNNRLPFNRL